MKILIYSDNHWCQNSSIVRGRGEFYSKRLENQLRSLNFVESLANKENCDAIVCAGDFFDRPDLNSEEISALRDIRWDPRIKHFFLVGNHDASNKALSFNSANLFTLCPNTAIITEPLVISKDDENFDLIFIPYISQSDVDEDIKIKNLIGQHAKNNSTYRIMISHNDLKGVQFGSFISKTGLDIQDIEQNCDVCFNGHLHNRSKISDKIYNIGNLTGQNFSEDAFTYKHGCIIVDTKARDFKFIENPHAFNFYKIDALAEDTLTSIKSNAILVVKCEAENVVEMAKRLKEDPRISDFKIIAIKSIMTSNASENNFTLEKVNHYNKFKTFIRDNLGENNLLLEELNYVCKE